MNMKVPLALVEMIAQTILSASLANVPVLKFSKLADCLEICSHFEIDLLFLVA